MIVQIATPPCEVKVKSFIQSFDLFNEADQRQSPVAGQEEVMARDCFIKLAEEK